MTNLPTIYTRYGLGIGVEVFIHAPDISNNEKTYLSADEVSAQTTLSTISGKNFTANEYILIGEWGEETAEIRKVASQTDTTLTTDALDYAHNRGTKIQFIPYNQIIVVRSDDSGATFSALDAIDIRPDSLETYLQRATDASTDVYKFRFYNSTTEKYSAYSDETTASGYADNTVYAIKKRALDQLGEKRGDLITDEFLNESLWEARRELDNDPRVLRWSFRIKLEENVSEIIPGTYEMTIPSDLRDPNTNKNILSLRLGVGNTPLTYQDVNKFNANYVYVAHTTIASAVTTGDTEITLTDSGNFDDSGDIDVAAPNISSEIDNIDYTGNTLADNELTTVTGIATAGHSAGVDVWQNANFGEPTSYTIDGDAGKIKFSMPFDDDYAGENIYMDYYSTIPAYNSDADTLDEPEYDCFVSYLKWKIKYTQSSGKLNPKSDNDYIEWQIRKESMIAKQYLGQNIYMIPN